MDQDNSRKLNVITDAELQDLEERMDKFQEKLDQLTGILEEIKRRQNDVLDFIKQGYR
jgi:ABC-type transporter Mla subunit MlaD